MLTGPKLRTALAGVKPIAIRAQLSRMVDFFDLTRQGNARFLYTSGRPNRFNPRGVHCLYLSDSRDTCLLELREYDPGYERVHPADTTYRVEVDLFKVLDLSLKCNRDAIGLSESELFAPWRLAIRPTATQRLGKMISETALFSSIRYPSNAARNRGREAWNLVVFRRAMVGGESLRIESPDGKHLEQWP